MYVYPKKRGSFVDLNCTKCYTAGPRVWSSGGTGRIKVRTYVRMDIRTDVSTNIRTDGRTEIIPCILLDMLSSGPLLKKYTLISFDHNFCDT